MPIEEQILAILRAQKAELHGRGAKHAALFSSVARDDARAESDIDILVELEPDGKRTVFGYAGLKLRIAELFSSPLDVIDKHRIKPDLREPVESDAIDAF
jgi:predicted nucleotidyltransferase